MGYLDRIGCCVNICCVIHHGSYEMNVPRIGTTPLGSAWECPLIPWSSVGSNPEHVGEQRDKHGVGNLVKIVPTYLKRLKPASTHSSFLYVDLIQNSQILEGHKCSRCLGGVI